MNILKYHNDINKIILSYGKIKNLINEEHNQMRITEYIRGVFKKI